MRECLVSLSRAVGYPFRRCLDLAVLRLDQPGELLQPVDELMQDVGRAGIFRIDLIVHRAQGGGGCVDPRGDQVDDFGGAVLVGRELRERGRRR